MKRANRDKGWRLELVETPQLKRGDWGRRVAERRFAATFPTVAERHAALATRQAYIDEVNAGIR